MSEEALQLAQKISHKVWEKYDNTYDYRSEKQEANAKVPTDHPDNIWFFWGQFDSNNHMEFAQRLILEFNDQPGAPELMKFVAEEIDREKQAIKDLADKGIFL